MNDESNAREGASPADDIKQQNPGATTTGDLTGEAVGAETAGQDDDADTEESGEDHPGKFGRPAKEGRDGLDTDAGQE